MSPRYYMGWGYLTHAPRQYRHHACDEQQGHKPIQFDGDFQLFILLATRGIGRKY
jgi:hypothetical protein